MNENTNGPTIQQMADAFQARQFLAKLAGCSKSGQQYLDSEMRACQIKIELRPDYKAVFQDVTHTCRETMADFIKVAIQERMERILNKRIADGEAA